MNTLLADEVGTKNLRERERGTSIASDSDNRIGAHASYNFYLLSFKVLYKQAFLLSNT